MNMKNVIKRCGVVFILGPIIIISLVLNTVIIALIIFWGPIYYIITGNNPLDVEPLFFLNGIRDWYLEKFGPDE